ncbi:MAG: TetR/AcrR family transcriptional regulator [Pseudomonadota bacterium]
MSETVVVDLKDTAEKLQPVRRSQDERTRAMRRRLIDAAIRAIDEEGYAGSSVTKIVERAGVSRGAHLHHFASKQTLMIAVAEDVVRSATRAVLSRSSSDRIDPANLVWVMWRSVVNQPAGRVFLEVMHASRSDPSLAEALRPVALRAIRLFRRLSRRRRAAMVGDAPWEDMLLLAQWTLRGMMMDAPLVRHPEFFDKKINTLVDMLQTYGRLAAGAGTDVGSKEPRGKR